MAARRSKQMGGTSRGSVRWHPPLPGFLKLNCDGTVNSDRNEVGVGGVFRNENGDFLGAVGKRIGLRLEPFDCELFAIKTGFWSLVSRENGGQ